MKTVGIGLGALALCAAAFAFRPAPETVVRERRVEVPVRVEVPIEVKKPVVVERERVVTRTAEEPAADRPAPFGEVLARENMMFLFTREASLDAGQRRHVRRVLAEREAEIERLQAGVLASKVLDARRYEEDVRRIQEDSYRRMAEVMSSHQRRRFMALLSEGRIGDAVEFEVPEDVVVLE